MTQGFDSKLLQPCVSESLRKLPFPCLTTTAARASTSFQFPISYAAALEQLLRSELCDPREVEYQLTLHPKFPLWMCHASLRKHFQISEQPEFAMSHISTDLHAQLNLTDNYVTFVKYRGRSGKTRGAVEQHGKRADALFQPQGLLHHLRSRSL